jgi:hypothetical protein
VRAAGAVLDVRELLVIGSQALHATLHGGLPVEDLQSVEADIASLQGSGAPAADLIDGTLGEGSMFHDTFGCYAHGVEGSWIATAVAGRDADMAFCRALFARGVVSREVLRERRSMLVGIAEERRALITARFGA